MKNATSNKKKTVYETLKKRIINHTLSPGTPIIESVLTKKLGTSKTPIREALQQLEKEGFVENIPGKGAFVSRISFQDIVDVFEIREILECEVIKRVAERGLFLASEVNAIKEKFESSGTNDKTLRSYFRGGDQVHSFIFEAFRNRRLLEYYKGLQEHIERLRLYFFKQVHPERADKSYAEHLEILNSLVAKDPARAEKAMKDHLQNSIEFQKKTS